MKEHLNDTTKTKKGTDWRKLKTIKTDLDLRYGFLKNCKAEQLSKLTLDCLSHQTTLYNTRDTENFVILFIKLSWMARVKNTDEIFVTFQFSLPLSAE